MIEGEAIRNFFANHGDKAVDIVLDEIVKFPESINELVEERNSSNEKIKMGVAHVIDALVVDNTQILVPFIDLFIEMTNDLNQEIKGIYMDALFLACEFCDQRETLDNVIRHTRVLLESGDDNSLEHIADYGWYLGINKPHDFVSQVVDILISSTERAISSKNHLLILSKVLDSLIDLSEWVEDKSAMAKFASKHAQHTNNQIAGKAAGLAAIC